MRLPVWSFKRSLHSLYRMQDIHIQITPGMPYNEVMHNIELVFENIDKFLDRMVEENTLLKQRVEQLEKQLQNGKECTNW